MDNVVSLFPVSGDQTERRVITARAIYHCIGSLLVDAVDHDLPKTEGALRHVLEIIARELREAAEDAVTHPCPPGCYPGD